MQIRCFHCHKPYALGKEEIQAALDYLNGQDLNHYNAPCPHCRRVNRVSKKDLQRFAPETKEIPEKDQA